MFVVVGAHLQRAPGAQGTADFLCPARLAGRQVGGLQAAGVVLVLRLALFVGGGLAGHLGGGEQQRQVGFEALADLLLQEWLVHAG